MPYKPAPPLPPELGLPDADVKQVMAFTNLSRRSVLRRCEDGRYESYKDGDRRLITWKSVLEDRERCRALGAQLSQRPASGKRPRGRPKKAPRPKRLNLRLRRPRRRLQRRQTVLKLAETSGELDDAPPRADPVSNRIIAL